MTKRDFILQAMLQLAGTGQYNDQFENKRLVTKEKRILDDAVKLADCAESSLWAGDVSNPSSVFEEENNVKKNYGHKAPCVRYTEGWGCGISPQKSCDGCAQYVPRTEQENNKEG